MGLIASASDNFERLKYAMAKINPMGSTQKRDNVTKATKWKSEDEKNNPVTIICAAQIKWVTLGLMHHHHRIGLFRGFINIHHLCLIIS